MTGEVLTRLTIWMAIGGYAAGVAVLAFSRGRARWFSTARLAWTFGWVSLLVHMAAAFHTYHGWSHAAAYRETARQTAEVFGLHWGGGLYVNYALLGAWALDILGWWRHGLDSYCRRPWPLVAVGHGLAIFILFNATVVFKAGAVRWVGLGLCLGLCVLWWHSRLQFAARAE